MDDFHGFLPRDFGLRPQGKASPMSSSSTSTRPSAPRRSWDPPPEAFNDGFGKPSRAPPPPPSSSYDSFSKPSAPPVYDRPVYDDDMFEGIPGLKPASSDQFDAVFSSPVRARAVRDEEDDLLRSLSGVGTGVGGSRDRSPPLERTEDSAADFDDLLPGFGVSVPAAKKEYPSSDFRHTIGNTNKTKRATSDDPFADFGTISMSSHPAPAVFVDPLENLKFASKETKSNISTGAYDDIDDFTNLKKSNVFDIDGIEVEKKNINIAQGGNHGKSSPFGDIAENLKGMKIDDEPERNEFVEVLQEHRLFCETSIDPSIHEMYLGKHVHQTQTKTNHHHDHQSQEFDGIWLNVSEVPLLTQPTRAPPPSRPPPPLDIRLSSLASRAKFASNNSHPNRTSSSSVSKHLDNKKLSDHPNGVVRGFGRTSFDGPEENNTRRIQDSADVRVGNFYDGEPMEANLAAATSAAAMKEAMDRAEVKLRYAREQREKEKEQRFIWTREFGQPQQVDKLVPDFQEPGIKESLSNFDHELDQREREAMEEKRRIEHERQKAASEKAMREAQERAASEKAMREAQERAASEKAMREAQERAAEKARKEAQERAALEKAMKEAQERAAAEKAMKEAQERAAVEKAMKEAQERAAADARLRAQRAAVDKANAEARERAVRAAAMRAEADARSERERAAKEAKEKAFREEREREAREEARAREVREIREREREARERETREREAQEKAIRDRERAAVERAAEDARRRAARAAVEKANAEARERAAAAAVAAAAAKVKQPKNEDDLDSFFGMGSRANSQPKQRTTGMEPFGTQVRSQGGNNEARPSSTGPSSNIRKASSTSNFLDDLSSVFGTPSSGEFQEIEGETEERRKARFERHQRTLERAAKALAEKNERDMQMQREQAEKHRIAETLDVEIRRWAAGKEGNLRALLSTLQYVLWPECGWQPVSLTDLITAAAVKKVYRKATLFIHPDKVQQKGANVQQKYIAEKVFDLLKEAWNKFNSEELF